MPCSTLPQYISTQENLGQCRLPERWQLICQGTVQSAQDIQNMHRKEAIYINWMHENVTNPIHDIVTEMQMMITNFSIDIASSLREKKNAKTQLQHLRYFTNQISAPLGYIDLRIHTRLFKKYPLYDIKIELLTEFGNLQNTLTQLPKCDGKKRKISSFVDDLILKIEEARDIIIHLDINNSLS